MSLAYGEWLERRDCDHPLLNHLILDKVFQHVRSKDLRECRLVCKKWNVSTIPFTRNAFKVTIIGSKEGETRTCTIENFMDVFRSNRLGIPFSRFRLGSFSTTDGVGKEFLLLCGHLTKEIEFVEGRYMIQDLSALLKSTLKLGVFQIPEDLCSRSGRVVKLFSCLEDAKRRLTYLRELSVSLDDRRSRNMFACPTFLEEVITAAENIAIVRLKDSKSVMGEFNKGSSLDLLSLIEEVGRESSIQELRLVHEWSDDSEYFELLRKMKMKPNGLKLKRFKYEPTPCFENQTTHGMLRLVSLFNDSLEHLELGGKSSACFTEFPKMSNLVRLSIRLQHDFSYKCVNLNQIFPVLEELGLFNAYYRSSQFYEFFPNSEPCAKMNAFFTDISFNLNGFNEMLTVFPNLTKLSLELGGGGAEILRQIWSHMTQLKYVTLSGTLYGVASVDSVLTGISTEALEEIEDAVANLERMPTALERREAIMRLRSQHAQLPSIGNLTHLRSLVLSLTGFTRDGNSRRTTNNEGGTCLTDLTGYLAIYSMKCLKKLEVKYCEFKKSCCKILTTDMGLQSWTFKTWQGRNIIPSEEELNLCSGLIDYSRAHNLASVIVL